MGEPHRSGRAGWLRAAVLGSDDALVSISSLMIGVAASSASKEAILVAAVAGLVAGSMSMAVGEYVSVSSQRDAELADVERETRELAGQPRAELHELALIYVKRGLEKALAMKVRSEVTLAQASDRSLAVRRSPDLDVRRSPVFDATSGSGNRTSCSGIQEPCRILSPSCS